MKLLIFYIYINIMICRIINFIYAEFHILINNKNIFLVNIRKYVIR